MSTTGVLQENVLPGCEEVVPWYSSPRTAAAAKKKKKKKNQKKKLQTHGNEPSQKPALHTSLQHNDDKTLSSSRPSRCSSAESREGDALFGGASGRDSFTSHTMGCGFSMSLLQGVCSGTAWFWRRCCHLLGVPTRGGVLTDRHSASDFLLGRTPASASFLESGHMACTDSACIGRAEPSSHDTMHPNIPGYPNATCSVLDSRYKHGTASLRRRHGCDRCAGPPALGAEHPRMTIHLDDFGRFWRDSGLDPVTP